MSALLRRYLMRTGHRQIPARPESDIVRERPPCAGHKIRDALQARQLHVVTKLLLLVLLLLVLRRMARQQSFDHKL